MSAFLRSKIELNTSNKTTIGLVKLRIIPEQISNDARKLQTGYGNFLLQVKFSV